MSSLKELVFVPACFTERLLGRAGIDMRCRPTPIALELTRTTNFVLCCAQAHESFYDGGECG